MWISCMYYIYIYILFNIRQLPDDNCLRNFYKKLHRLGDEYIAKNRLNSLKFDLRDSRN